MDSIKFEKLINDLNLDYDQVTEILYDYYFLKIGDYMISDPNNMKLHFCNKMNIIADSWKKEGE